MSSHCGGPSLAVLSAVLKRLLFSSILIVSAIAEPQGQKPPNLYMMIYNYRGSSDFTSARLSSFALSEDGFSPLQKGTLKTQRARCESLLSYSQRFSLGLMQSIGYISNEQARFQKNVENEVRPDQVIFSEISTLEDKKPVSRDYGRPAPIRSKGRVLTSVMGVSSREYQERKKTAMWLISGQTLSDSSTSQDSSDIQLHNMPWQNDPAFQQSAKTLDRDKYKFAWELGRAGQIPGQKLIIHNITALIIAAHKERKQLEKVSGPGGAYIFMHALDLTHTKLFERMYGAKIFATDKNNSGNNILIMSLDEMLAKYPISRLSERVQKIKDLGQGQISDLQALDLLEDLSESSLSQLDLFEGDEKVSREPVVIENYSLAVLQALLETMLDELKLTADVKAKVYSYLANQLPEGYQPSVSGADFVPSIDPWKKFAKHNTIVISNLDQELAVKDQHYIGDVIRAIRAHYEELLEPVKEARPLFKGGQLTFIVRTFSRELAESLIKAGGKLESEYPNQLQFTIEFNDRFMNSIKGTGRLQVKSGYWQSHHLLSKPLEF